ncbi:MAG TPA: LacI family DNA-binding transcriptional regulator [Candidatus Choladousia intestinigallinarum]|nr:LacI family DNA-binding transcriptional regulator [Candidatus Choladousia intestinigallinarum]
MATLKDVARESGLTVGTVSRVLNNRGYISEKTRQKVYRVMKELNYQPNEMARSLSTQRTNTIGVIVPHIVHPYFAKMIDCLEEAAYESNYKILLFSSKGKTDLEEKYIEMCWRNRVSGVILFSGLFHTEVFKNLDFPVITIERFIDEATAGIVCDNYQGGMLATEHLIEQGCRCLLHIGGVNQMAMPADGRKVSFETVCQKMGVQYMTINPDDEYYNEMDYYAIIRLVLEQNPQIDGIFASSDLIAAQVIQICKEKQIQVPEQLKVVGFDDVNIASLTTPRITTIRQPVKEMADAAVSALNSVLSGETVAKEMRFPVSLIKREST